MTDQGNHEELLNALNNITAELKRINQTLGGLAAGQQNARPAGPASRGPASRGPISRGPAGARGGAKPAYGKPRKEGFGASELEGGDREAAPRFQGKKPAPRTGGRKPAPKSPLSFKKKDGYPKRPKP